MIVCAPAGAVAVTVTAQLTVPTGLAPCVRAQPLNVSLLDGLLASVNVTVPAGFNAVPVLVSETVIVNAAVPPTPAVVLAGVIVIVVVRDVTVTAVLTAEVKFPLEAVSV